MKLSFSIQSVITSVLLLSTVTFAQTSLRTSESILVDTSYVQSTGVVADPEGLVYFEMVEGTYVIRRENKTRFSGEILPPSIITEEFYLKNPRGRMREIIPFEIASDTLESLLFVDYYDITHPKNRERASLFNPDGLTRTKQAKVIIPLFQEYGKPALWEYIGEDDKQWVRLGGSVNETQEDGIQLLTAIINGTGIFVLFDENPDPDNADDFIPYTEIELAPTGPFTSVPPKPVEVPDIFIGNPTTTNIDTVSPFGPNTDEINIPFEEDDFINPNPTTEIKPIEETLTVAPGIGAFGVAPDQFGLNGNFRFPNRDQQPTVDGDTLRAPAPILEGNAPQTPTQFIPPTTGDKITPQNTLIDPFLENFERPADTSARSSDRIQELIAERLLQENESPTFVFTEEPETTAPSAPKASNTINQTIEQALLQASSIETDPLLTEVLEIEETEEFFPAAEKGSSLPKTGRNIFITFLTLLVFSGGYWFWFKRKPKQMKMKIK